LQLPYSVIRIDSGQMFAIYHSELGRGSFGRVKVGQNIETGDLVAIKIEEVKNDKKFSKNIKRIKNEQSITGDAGLFFGGQTRSKTKSLAKVYSVMPIITGLEFLRGQAKFHEAVQNVSDENVAGLAMLSINMALSTAEHLARLHAKNIIHRDLHLGNILVDGSGLSIIIDYGCSLRLDEKTKSIKASVKGHYAYYSEDLKKDYYKGRKHNYTTKEDLFALGKCMDEYKIIDILRQYGSRLGFDDSKVQRLMLCLQALKSDDPNKRPEATELVPLLQDIKKHLASIVPAEVIWKKGSINQFK